MRLIQHTQMTIRQTFKEARLLPARWRHNGGCEALNVMLSHFQGDFRAASHYDLVLSSRFSSCGTM